MKERGPDPREVERIVDLALREDVGSGDITSGSVFGENEVLSAAVRVKERGVICGLGVAGAVFRKMDGECEWEEMTRDGLATAPGDVVARVTGNARGVSFRGALRSKHPAADERHIDSHLAFRRGRAGNRSADNGHEKDRSGFSRAGQVRGRRGRRAESPKGALRRRAHKGTTT